MYESSEKANIKSLRLMKLKEIVFICLKMSMTFICTFALLLEIITTTQLHIFYLFIQTTLIQLSFSTLIRFFVVVLDVCCCASKSP